MCNLQFSIWDSLFGHCRLTIIEQLLDRNRALHFALLRLQLIELIKKMFEGPESDKPRLFGAAVSFAQQNLAPYTPQSEQFKSDLERAMALLIVPREAWQSKPSSQLAGNQTSAFGPLGDLVDPSLKIQVADEVNAAIDRSQGRPGYSKAHRILQTRAWVEEYTEGCGLLPADADLSIHVWDVPDDQSANGNNGDTQMTEDIDEGSSDPIQRYTNIESAR